MSKHQETPLGHCLGCVPVRTGVLAFACFLLFLSLCAVAGIVTEDTRILVGGYNYWTNIAVDILGCLGVIICLMGIVGVNDNHTRWVRWFTNFALLRVIARVFILWGDIETLNGCETFGISSLSGHYNSAMQTVVLQGSCLTTRPAYWAISVADILISLHGVWNAYYWCNLVDHCPMYHIAIDDTKPLRIYTGYSTVGHPEVPPRDAPQEYAQEKFFPQGDDNNYASMAGNDGNYGYASMTAHPMGAPMQPGYGQYGQPMGQPMSPGFPGSSYGAVQQPQLPY